MIKPTVHFKRALYLGLSCSSSFAASHESHCPVLGLCFPVQRALTSWSHPPRLFSFFEPSPARAWALPLPRGLPPPTFMPSRCPHRLCPCPPRHPLWRPWGMRWTTSRFPSTTRTLTWLPTTRWRHHQGVRPRGSHRDSCSNTLQRNFNSQCGRRRCHDSVPTSMHLHRLIKQLQPRIKPN